MTPLHKRIAGLLYPVLLETTRKQRVARQKPEGEENLVKIRELLADETKKGNMHTSTTEMWRGILHLLTKSDVFQTKIGSPNAGFAPFTVLFGTFNKTKDSLAICLHEQGHYLREDGSAQVFTIASKMIASDDQVKECLEDLSAQQLRFIMSNALFAPVMNALYEAEEEPEPDKAETTKA